MYKLAHVFHAENLFKKINDCCFRASVYKTLFYFYIIFAGSMNFTIITALMSQEHSWYDTF